MSEIGENLRGRYPVKRFSFSQSTAATQTAVAAVAGKQIVVLSIFLKAATGQTIQFKSAANNISGAMVMATSDLEVALADGDNGILATAVGEAFGIALTAASLVAGFGSYIEV
jgi:hypothetical protein